MCFVPAMALSASPQQLMLELLPNYQSCCNKESSAKMARQGSEQTKGRRSPQKLPIKDDEQVGAPVFGNFSAHREKSSILQRATWWAQDQRCCSHHPTVVLAAAALVLRSESDLTRCPWVTAKSYQEGWDEWQLLETRQCRAERKKAPPSTPLPRHMKCTYL